MADQNSDRPPQNLLDQIAEGLDDDKAMSVVIGYARKRVRLLGFDAPDVAEDRAEQMIHDAIADTATGRRKWRPDRVALSTHLCGIINDRVLKMLNRGKRVEEVPLDERENWNHDEPCGFETAIIDRELAHKVKGHLFELAEEKGDEQVQFLLMAYEEHCFKRSDIAEKTGMTVDEVTNAGKRLDRLIDHLPQELQWGGKSQTEVKGNRNE